MHAHALKYVVPLAFALAAPATASTVVNGSCVSVTDSHGCLFSGNINTNGGGNANSYVTAQNAYNLYNNTHPSAQPDILLTPIASSDDGNFSNFGSITGGGGASGTWSLPNFLVDFVAVKAADYFVLYQLSTPSNSGSWNTFDIPYKNNPHDLSHLVFFGTGSGGGVPEPATWALMILGFGAVAGGLRRRNAAQTKVRFAA